MKKDDKKPGKQESKLDPFSNIDPFAEFKQDQQPSSSLSHQEHKGPNLKVDDKKPESSGFSLKGKVNVPTVQIIQDLKNLPPPSFVNAAKYQGLYEEQFNLLKTRELEMDNKAHVEKNKAVNHYLNIAYRYSEIGLEPCSAHIQRLCKKIVLLFKDSSLVDSKQGFKKYYEQLNDKNLPNNQLYVKKVLLGEFELDENPNKSVSHLNDAYSLQQGVIEPNAHKVLQAEVGFSDKDLMGTDNIRQCVVVIIRDPITKLSALAHIDKNTNVKSIGPTFNKFNKGAALECYLIGGSDQSWQNQSISNNNVYAVVNELCTQAGHTINIKEQMICNPNAPPAIVFDPKTGKCRDAVPGKQDPFLNENAVYFSKRAQYAQVQNKPYDLQPAFDLTLNQGRKPMLSHQMQEELIQQFAEKKNQKFLYPNKLWQINQIRYPEQEALEGLLKEKNLRNLYVDLRIDHYIKKSNKQLSQKEKDNLQEELIKVKQMLESSNQINRDFVNTKIKSVKQKVLGKPPDYLNK